MGSLIGIICILSVNYSPTPLAPSDGAVEVWDMIQASESDRNLKNKNKYQTSNINISSVTIYKAVISNLLKNVKRVSSK
jgi:hypothetical protein